MTEHSLLRQQNSFDRIVDALATYGVKTSSGGQAGRQAMSRCPVHGSRQGRTLSITYFPELRETKTNCFAAECTRHQVLETIGLPAWAAYDDPPRPCEACGKDTIIGEDGRYLHDFCRARLEGRPPAPRKPKERVRPVRMPALPELIAEPPERKFTVVQRVQVTKTWEHITLEGEVVANSVRKEQVRRYAGDDHDTVHKTFVLEYSDGKGGWCRKADSPVELVPVWRLPEVRAAIAAGEPVFHCEGHKAAEAVVEAGACGTTVLSGVLDDSTAPGLVGAELRIIADRDLVGYDKALKAYKAVLDGVSSTVTLWLSATTGPGDDAYDHLKAGFTLDQLVPIDADHLQVKLLMGKVRGGPEGNLRLNWRDLDQIQRETSAWVDRAAAAADAGDEAAAAVALEKAKLWARAAGHRMRQLVALAQQLERLTAATAQDRSEMAALIADNAAATLALYEQAELDIDDDLQAVLRPTTDSDDDHGAGDDAGQGGKVLSFPLRAVYPRFVIDVPGDWRYDDGSGDCPRGVFNSTSRGDDAWYRQMAPLPYVHARIVRRDGRGHVVAIDLLISAAPDSAQIVINRDELGNGVWANRVGIPLSWDPKTRQATATAIETYAAANAPERESIPRMGQSSGLLEIPIDGCDQFFRTSSCTRDEGLDLWRDVVAETVEAPKLAHLIGASAIAPFSRHISRTLPHWVSLTGPMGRGKTQALKLAAAVWGDSLSRDTTGSLYGSWSASHQAVPQMLGELNIMPTFLDEAGATGYTKQQWGQLIYRISLGASRKRTNVRDGRVTTERSWHSILFTSANDDLTAGIDSGVFQGTIRRVIEIPAPPTADREQGNRLVNDDPFELGLAQRCYGHLGMQIAETVTVQQAAEYLKQARMLLPAPEGDAGEIAALLQLHLAGALLVDDVLGTGEFLTQAALASTREALERWLPGQSEGDKVLDLVRESLTSQPTAWPDQETYTAAFNDIGGASGERHRALIRDLFGLRCDDGAIAVLPSTWKRFLDEANVSPQQAQAELEDRGLLVRNMSAKNRNHTFQTQQRFGIGRSAAPTRVYKIYVPDPDVDEDEGLGEIVEPPSDGSIEADSGGPEPVPAVPTSPYPAPNTAVTRGVTGVPGYGDGVTGGVTASEIAVTRGVTGVTGLRGGRAHDGRDVGAHARATLDQAPLDGAEQEDRMPTNVLDRGGYEGWTASLHPAEPCGWCGQPAAITIDQMPCHVLCWHQSTRVERADRLNARRAVDQGWKQLDKPWPDCVVCGEPASQAKAGLPLHAGDCEDRFEQRSAPVAPPPITSESPEPPSRSERRQGVRWLADAAVLDVDAGWLSSGVQVGGAGAVAHAGDVYEWAMQHQLGFGGTKNHQPEPGHVWLTANFCQRYGLPTGPFRGMGESDDALTAMRQSRFFTDAEAAGWEIDSALIQPWLRLRRNGKTIIITGVGWGTDRYSLLLQGNPDPATLAGRLGYLTRLIGFPFTLTPASTGLHMLGYHTSHGLPAVNIPSWTPPGAATAAPVVFNDIGALPAWINTEAVDELVAEHPDWWAHKFDKRASYAASAGAAILGSGTGIHRPDGCEFDKRVAGIYRIAPLDGPTIPELPGFDLRDPMGHGQASGWVSRAAVDYLLELGHPVDIQEAITWAISDSGAQLKDWQASVKLARERLASDVQGGNLHAKAISDSAMFKQVYAGAIGSLAATRGRLDPLQPQRRYYPHWRAEIVGTHTVSMLRTIRRVANADPGHRFPVAVGMTDAIVYIGPSADPADVWPGTGADGLTNPALGKYVPNASAQLGAWEQLWQAQLQQKRPGQRMASRIGLIGKAGREW